jgi:hypothetical protein
VVSRGRRIAIAIAALARGSKAIVELLVAFGADLNGVNPAKRFTALHAVAQSGKEDVATAEWLLGRGYVHVCTCQPRRVNCTASPPVYRRRQNIYGPRQGLPS